MSNCVKDDLAYITHPDRYGRFVTVLSQIDDPGPTAVPGYPLWWLVRAEGWLELTTKNPKEFFIPDAILRPIRDPGPQAVDQIKKRVPLPCGYSEIGASAWLRDAIDDFVEKNQP